MSCNFPCDSVKVWRFCDVSANASSTFRVCWFVGVLVCWWKQKWWLCVLPCAVLSQHTHNTVQDTLSSVVVPTAHLHTNTSTHQHTLKIGMNSVPGTSWNLHIFKLLSALETSTERNLQCIKPNSRAAQFSSLPAHKLHNPRYTLKAKWLSRCKHQFTFRTSQHIITINKFIHF